MQYCSLVSFSEHYGLVQDLVQVGPSFALMYIYTYLSLLLLIKWELVNAGQFALFELIFCVSIICNHGLSFTDRFNSSHTFIINMQTFDCNMKSCMGSGVVILVICCDQRSCSCISQKKKHSLLANSFLLFSSMFPSCQVSHFVYLV